MTFAVTPPGWRAWVLAHPRNLATCPTTGWISAYAGGLPPVHPPLAYPIYASGMENKSAYAAGLAP